MEDQENLNFFEGTINKKFNDNYIVDAVYDNFASIIKSTTPDSFNDTEPHILRLKKSLESWREIVLLIHSILLWEKNWYPGAIIGGTSFVFLSVWVLDPSVLTTFSILGLTLTISDYVVPLVSATIFKPESWTEEKENELNNFCRSIVAYKSKMDQSCASFCDMRSSKPKMYYGFTICTLAVLAWVGNSFNNLFLTYLLLTLSLLIPGMEFHGIVHKFGSVLSEKMSQYSKFNLLAAKKEQ